jgi:hypothetical protein
MERATSLWRAGLTLTQIAAQITEAFGIERTKNAVAGKLDKLGLIGTRSIAKRCRARKSAQQRAGAISHGLMAEVLPRILGEPEGLPPDEPIPETAVTLEYREDDQCVWPVNHGEPEFLYCGATKGGGEFRFCAHHARLAHPLRLGGVNA